MFIEDWGIIAFRALVIIIAILIVLNGAGRFTRNAGSVLVLAFLLAYLARLLFDLSAFGSMPEPMEEQIRNSLVFFIVTVCIPVLAVLSKGFLWESDEQLSRILVRLGLILMIALILLSQSGMSHNPWSDVENSIDRLWLKKINPISIGNAAATVFLSGLTLLTHFSARRFDLFFTSLAIASAALVLVLANSRGPIISCALATTWLLVTKRNYASLALQLLFLATIAYLFFHTTSIDHVTARFFGSSASDQSSLARIVALNAAFDAFLDKPIAGAFAFHPDLEVGDYPHNLFAETAMALGFVGLVILLAVCFLSTRNLSRFYARQHPLLSVLFLHFFLEFQFSSSIFGASIFFVLLALLASSSRPRISSNYVS